MRPIQNLCLIKVLEAPDMQNGLYLPELKKAPPEEGIVVAAGPGLMQSDGTLSVMHVKVGDRVIFRKYAGESVQFEGHTHILMRETEILAVVEE